MANMNGSHFDRQLAHPEGLDPWATLCLSPWDYGLTPAAIRLYVEERVMQHISTQQGAGAARARIPRFYHVNRAQWLLRTDQDIRRCRQRASRYLRPLPGGRYTWNPWGSPGTAAVRNRPTAAKYVGRMAVELEGRGVSLGDALNARQNGSNVVFLRDPDPNQPMEPRYDLLKQVPGVYLGYRRGVQVPVDQRETVFASVSPTTGRVTRRACQLDSYGRPTQPAYPHIVQHGDIYYHERFRRPDNWSLPVQTVDQLVRAEPRAS